MNTWVRSSGGFPIPRVQTDPGGAFALRFPSNVNGTENNLPYTVIQFSTPQDNGMPMWGASSTGVSGCRKIQPHQQTGYYAQFWYTRGDGTFDGVCYGMHPYPQSQSSSGTTHWWEIAADSGDYIDADGNVAGSGSPTTVTQDLTVNQGWIHTRANANSKTLKFYHRLPDVTTADYIQRTITTASWGESALTSCVLVMGDSPWFAGFQNERASMDLDSIKLFNQPLTESELLQEAADYSRIVTAAGQAAIWWGKNGFDSVDDLTCDYGTGRSFSWANANKGTLVARL